MLATHSFVYYIQLIRKLKIVPIIQIALILPKAVELFCNELSKITNFLEKATVLGSYKVFEEFAIKINL